MFYKTDIFYLINRSNFSGLSESERERCNSVMSLDDDDDQVEFIEPDCVVGELVTSFLNAPWY
jgi:hypothetical protein